MLNPTCITDCRAVTDCKSIEDKKHDKMQDTTLENTLGNWINRTVIERKYSQQQYLPIAKNHITTSCNQSLSISTVPWPAWSPPLLCTLEDGEWKPQRGSFFNVHVSESFGWVMKAFQQLRVCFLRCPCSSKPCFASSASGKGRFARFFNPGVVVLHLF